ncbi:hypothetical protein DPMN_023420 [Dreissena polymorpha]|uniref:Uncharacterized protein n=1 Tax=Dreissena polymorpha TaxID=45954 RepID=A0A9D4R9W5_DREPO|nr:hypothetical protein DPMN_023420 [Dreissena polymorpha]
MQNKSIFISSSTSHSHLAAFLNPAQHQLPQEVSATVNPEAVAFPTHFDMTCEGLFFGVNVNISNLNVYYGDAKVEK